MKVTKIRRNSGAKQKQPHSQLFYELGILFHFVSDAFFCLIFSINYNFNLCHTVPF